MFNKIKLELLVVVLAILLTSSLSFAQDKPIRKMGGFIQSTIQKGEDDKALTFGFDRVRFIAKGELNARADYKIMVDFMKTATDVDKDGDTPGIIKDALLIFKPTEKLRVSIGKYKTPVGMEFNTSGMDLDFAKRGMIQKLIFERSVGLMLHAKKIGGLGLGYNLGLFNNGPNAANDIGDPASAQDYTITGRLSAAPSKFLYAEASFGMATTNIEEQESVSIFSIGAKATLVEALQLKGEFLSRTDGNNATVDGTDFYIQGGYQITPKLQPVVKYEVLDVTNVENNRTDTTIGLNYFLNPKSHRQAKIQINYVISDMDGSSGLQILCQGAF